MSESPCEYRELHFTPRELEVLGGLVRGDLQVMIAERLDISEARVEVLVRRIKEKLKSATIGAATAKAVKIGLVDPFDCDV